LKVITMRYREALKLHNNDEVTLKSNHKVVRVISVEEVPEYKSVIVYAVTEQGFSGLLHNEIS